jgi:hypothetical protein
MAVAAETLVEFHMDDYLDEGILRESPFRERLKQIDWSAYDDQKVLIKGCGAVPIPTWAYMLATAYLTPHAAYIGYGEGCSAVTIYKRPK